MFCYSTAETKWWRMPFHLHMTSQEWCLIYLNFTENVPTQKGKTPYQLHIPDALLLSMDVCDRQSDVQRYVAIDRRDVQLYMT